MFKNYFSMRLIMIGTRSYIIIMKDSPNEDLTLQQICKKSSMLTWPCLLAYLKVNEDKTGVLSLNPSLANASVEEKEVKEIFLTILFPLKLEIWNKRFDFYKTFWEIGLNHPNVFQHLFHKTGYPPLSSVALISPLPSLS